MATLAAHPVIRLSHPDRLFIGGSWIEPAKGGRIEVISAHSEAVIATVAEATEADMDAAVAAARHAFDEGPWPRMDPAERAAWLRKLHAALEPRVPELVRAWIDQIGSLATVAPFVIGGGMATLQFTIDQAETYPFVETRAPADGHGEAMIVREPVGVAVTIVPWNNPFGIMISKVAGALLAGCTVIMKPAPETPIEAFIIAEAADEIGLPAGVLNLVPSHREAADHLVRNPGVDKVSLTGSTIAGKRVASVCGERLARCTLELGGKSAAIVLDDYDLEAAAKMLTSTIIMSAGQVCATLSRVIVSKHRHDALVEAIRAEMEKVRVGDPFDPATQLGPLALERQRDRVLGYVEAGNAGGARLVFGGGRPLHLARGYYVEPTLFSCVDRSMKIAQEEIFGPVLSVLPVAGEADAIRAANASDFGLYGAVFTHDRESAYRVARGMRTGTVTHNIFRFDPHLPFGGFKQSGIGREGGVAGITSYTELKSILLDAPADV
ncbi:acyl-CoA reductase-like NAD-dependent aldehyde dehydrogenase [Sphingobium xanthum]|uniref:aldehyde dehydrogenase n=1 Tax=Sphingobium xanthum TaxID=1387165 RepID=UPI001C8C9DD5|nr:aldehyde dehydrogenase [Sphingobium xanthum]